MPACVLEQETETSPSRAIPESWPTDAQDMMSRLTDTFPPMLERRRVPRKSYHVQATLQLLHGSRDDAPLEVYSRDVNPWSMGFITPHPLPAYEHAVMEFTAEDGSTMHLKCMIRRCKTFAPGWCQGVIDFEREQTAFSI